MKLWYTKWELREARQEAQQLVDKMNDELPIYIRGDVKLRMAWREEPRSSEHVPIEDMRVYGATALRTFIPEAELLINGEVARRDILDLLLLDLLHLQMKCLSKNFHPPVT